MIIIQRSSRGSNHTWFPRIAAGNCSRVLR